MNKVKAMLSKVNSKGNSNPLLFRPAAGENKIRIVPLEANPENPFQILQFHYLGNKTYLSPLTYGKPDPIAEFKDALLSEGRLSVEEFKKAMQFAPSPRTYLPVVERGKEKDGIKYWAFGKKTCDQIEGFFVNPEYGDLSDIVTGVDITINFTPKEQSATKFAETSLVVSRKSTPLSDDPAIVKLLTTNQPDLVDSFEKYSYEQLKSVLDAYVNSLAAAAAAAGESTTNETSPVVKSEEEVSAAVAATDKEFDDVFNS